MVHEAKRCKTTNSQNVLQRWNRYTEGIFPDIKERKNKNT